MATRRPVRHAASAMRTDLRRFERAAARPAPASRRRGRRLVRIAPPFRVFGFGHANVAALSRTHAAPGELGHSNWRRSGPRAGPARPNRGPMGYWIWVSWRVSDPAFSRARQAAANGYNFLARIGVGGRRDLREKQPERRRSRLNPAACPTARAGGAALRPVQTRRGARATRAAVADRARNLPDRPRPPAAD